MGLVHVNCAGSTTTASIRATQPLVDETLRLNPNMTGNPQKTVQTFTGAPFFERSAFRARFNVRQESEVYVSGVISPRASEPIPWHGDMLGGEIEAKRSFFAVGVLFCRLTVL